MELLEPEVIEWLKEQERLRIEKENQERIQLPLEIEELDEPITTKVISFTLSA